MKNKLNIGIFPFYWRTYDDNHKVNYPVVNLKFELSYDEVTGHLIQVRNNKLLSTIEEIYKLDHGIGYLQEDRDEFHTYGKEWIEFILCQIDKLLDKENLKILDIGCGGCGVLKILSKTLKKPHLLGIDPSPISTSFSKKYNINIIKDFFPPKNTNYSPVDVILHYDVLEHIIDPLQFLKDIYKDLRMNGIVIIKVPDCTKSFSMGDISILSHEHLNYFTKISLKNIVKMAGFSNVEIKNGKIGGSLFCKAEKLNEHYKLRLNNKQHGIDFEQFLIRNKSAVTFFKKNLKKYDGCRIGFYVPLRAIPYIAILKISRPFRFFDDSNFFANRFLDGFEDIRIEPFSGLVNNPVDVIFIMSHAFSDKIKKRILSANLNCKIVTILELLK